MAEDGRPGKVLVLGQEDRAFLAVVRSLGRRGIDVHVAWCPSDAVALKSRYLTQRHALPRYTRDDSSWMRQSRPASSSRECSSPRCNIGMDSLVRHTPQCFGDGSEASNGDVDGDG